MSKPNRRELIQSLTVAGVGSSAGSLLAAAQNGAADVRISGFEVIPLRVPMDLRVREAWQRSWFLQNRFQTHHEPVLVKLKTDAGIVGIGDSMLSPARTKAIAEKMVGRSPWEYLLDDSIRALLVPICDIVGQALELPVSRLFARNPKAAHRSNLVEPMLQARPDGIGSEDRREPRIQGSQSQSTSLGRPGRAG